MCSPTVSADVENLHYDDRQTPTIPIMPVEDDDTVIDASSDFPSLVTQPPSEADENTPGSALGPDVMAAASAALSAISKSKEQGDMVDPDLLIKILSNPKMVENLVASYRSASVSTHAANGTEITIPATSNGHVYPQLNGIQVSPTGYSPPPPSQPGFGSPLVRDANYYKNLIHQHGGERQEPPPVQHTGHRFNHQSGGGSSQETINNNNQRPRDSKPKIMKPCIYFNSSRGCRHGDNCVYQHDTAAYQPRSYNNGPELQNTKRMRFD